MKTTSSDSTARLCISAVCMLLVLVLALTLTGCRPPEDTSTQNVSESDSTNDDEPTKKEKQCENWVQSIIKMSHPGELEIKVENGVVLGLLNDWGSNCGTGTSEIEKAAVQQWLSDEQIEGLLSDRFEEGDAEHIRDCILNHLIWESVAAGQESDLERVRKAFDFVVNNMALDSALEDLNLSRHEHLLWGVGTAEDRALLFVDILRQNRIDCCILTPVGAPEVQESSEKEASVEEQPEAETESESAEETPATEEDSADEEQVAEAEGEGEEISEEETPAESAETSETEEQVADGEGELEKPWLVGVLLGDGIYLFNTQMGLPIPGPDNDESSFAVTDVATLEEVTSDESLLKKLDIDEEHPFPLTAEDMKNLRVEMVGYPRLWMPRFSRFQTQLPLSAKFLIYDGLVDDKSGQGLPSRLVTQSKGKWNIEDLKLWPHPLQSQQDGSEPSEQLKGLKELFDGSLAAYFEGVKEVRGSDANFRVTPSNGLWRTRLAYLSGQHTKAVQQFVGMQVIMRSDTGVETVLSAEELDQMDRRRAANFTRFAESNIVYWLGTAQLTLGRDEQAGDLLSDYLRRYRSQGFWSTKAMNHIIPAYARSGKYALALQVQEQVLQQIPEGTLEHYVMELQLQRVRTVQREERLREAK